MTVEEIRVIRTAEAERTKNMSTEDIITERHEKAEKLFEQIEKIKSEKMKIKTP